MRELKPITDSGEPGTIVLVAVGSAEGDDGERFALPVTDELRSLVAAATSGSGDAEDAGDARDDATADAATAGPNEAAGDRTGQAAGDGADAEDGGEPARPATPPEPRMILRPREIQDRVRAGASVDELIELTGMPARRIEPFAHPVLAERARIAELGKESRPRRADGPAQLTLREILATAFAARGLDVDDAEWDAWRDATGQWIIGVTWAVGHSTTTAEWAFHTQGASSSTVARNPIAAELVDPDFVRPRRTLSPVGDEGDAPRPATLRDAGSRAGAGSGHGHGSAPDDAKPGHSRDADDVADDDGEGDFDDDDFLRHPDDRPSPRRRRKTVMPSWEDVLLGVRPTERK